MTRPQLAAVVTEYRRYSHAQHILDRFLFGYGWGGRHHHPAMDLVALYTDQVPKGDLSRERAKLAPAMTIYPTIAEALCRGGDKLAVDGVLLIGEHGSYPRNEKGQTLYPRYEFFQQIVDVFRASGRSVPVFNDKHLSWNWDWAKEMVDTSKELGFAFLAGSSLPVARRLPPVDLPLGAEVEEATCIAPGGPDGYDIHALEAIQAMVERRRGGETGVVAVQALRGDAVWKAMKAGSWDSGGWDPALFEACLCRSHTLGQAREGFNDRLSDADEVPRLVGNNPAIAYRCEYADGLKTTMLLLEGLVGDFTFAARLNPAPSPSNPLPPGEGRVKGAARGGRAGEGAPLSTAMYLPPREVCNFFSPLVHHCETMFLTGKAPYPIERTLLTTGLTAAGVESLWRGGKRLETPHLAVRYQPTEESTFWRG
jgi:hypothetical protein